jgi:hypothetical protein
MLKATSANRRPAPAPARLIARLLVAEIPHVRLTGSSQFSAQQEEAYKQSEQAQ